MVELLYVTQAALTSPDLLLVPDSRRVSQPDFSTPPRADIEPDPSTGR